MTRKELEFLLEADNSLENLRSSLIKVYLLLKDGNKLNSELIKNFSIDLSSEKILNKSFNDVLTSLYDSIEDIQYKVYDKYPLDTI